MVGVDGATNATEGGFMGGNDAAQKAADDAKIFKAIVEGAVSVGGSVVLAPMIMEMQKDLNKQET